MLLALDAGDRLARLLAGRGRVPLGEAAIDLLALRGGGSTASVLLERALAGDARFSVEHGHVALAPAPHASTPLDQARFAVVDVETSGLSASSGQIIEVACVLVERGALVAERDAHALPEVGDAALWRVLRLTDDAVLAGHNLRFDTGFLDARLRTLYGARVASAAVDTLPLARRLLRGRTRRFSLGALAHFFGVPTEPAHRALPDARATAEVLLELIALAGERGARTVGDLCALAG
jgi:DNA polymerase III epsilon subunit-like protein